MRFAHGMETTKRNKNKTDLINLIDLDLSDLLVVSSKLPSCLITVAQFIYK